MTWYEIHTESGSIYWIGRDGDEQWWLGARNIANPASQELEARRYAIASPTPWPPIVGYPLVVAARPDMAPDDPQQLPGGGKWTSRVVHVATHDEAPPLD